VTAHRLALASPRVRSISIEAQEYPSVAAAYAVSSVPKIVVNDRVAFLGALPEVAFVDAILSAVGDSAPSAPAEDR
jgi:predicted DsbA family dithiol-disulfide isomerase